jgi:beta-lactamase regulating signal transducer with metallopeptidase domain
MSFPTFLANNGTAEIILNLAAQSLFIFVLSWGFSLLCRRGSAPLRSGGMLILILILAFWPLKIAFFPAAQGGLYRIPIASPVSFSTASLAPDSARLQNNSRTADRRDTATANSQGTEQNDGSSVARSAPLAIIVLNIVGLIWLAGALFFLGRIFFGMAYLAGFRGSLKEIADRRLDGILAEIKAEFPETKIPPIYSSPAVASPLAFGLRRPRIVLPEILLSRLSPSEWRSILIHETAHLRHRDQLAGFAQRLVTAIYWWNPLAYSLSARFSIAREEVSDNYGILKNGALPYAECLVDLAQKTSLITKLPSAVGMATPHISLEERIMDIVSNKRSLKTRLALPVLLGLIFIAFGGAALVGRSGFALDVFDMRSPSQAKIVPLPMVQRSVALAVGKDKIYLWDADLAKADYSIKILAASDYSLIRSFGRRGKGPGEFLTSAGMPYLAGTDVWSQDVRKIVVFNSEGEFKKEIPFPPEFRGMFQAVLPLGDHFVALATDWTSNSSGQLLWQGRVFDKEFKNVKQFVSDMPSLYPPPPPPPPPPPGQKEPAQKESKPEPKSFYEAIPECIDLAVADDKIFVADTRRGFHIAVFDDQGRPLYEITKPYDKLKVPGDFQGPYLQFLKQKNGWLLNQADIKFRDYYPAFYFFKIADHKIYIATYAKKDGLNELYVLDLKGNILKRSFCFPLDQTFDSDYHNFSVAKIRCDIGGGKLYFLMKNEKTDSYELHIQDIE